jgi:cyclopropane fatty-acyl-phospholipid synthase-like methyltransferase
MNPGRAETIRYHEALYRAHRVFTPGSWLHKPATFVMAAADRLRADRPQQVLDLGCGAGRHSIPIAARLCAQSQVIAVDLLPEALSALRETTGEYGVTDKIQTIESDFASFHYHPNRYDLIVSCSAIEHCASETEFAAVLTKMADATAPGGFNCLVIGTRKTEILDSGIQRPALTEFALPTAHALTALENTYASWEIVAQSQSTFSVLESRDHENYALESHCIRYLVRKPDQSVQRGRSE